MKYIVMHASAKMPSSCWGTYRRVAVVELTDEYATEGKLPTMISARAIGVERLVETWEKRHVGKTERCAFRVALREAEEMADELNAATAGVE